MTRFSGSMNLGSDGFRPEFDATIDIYKSLGYAVQADLTPAAFLITVGGAFVPEELPPIAHARGVSPSTLRYLSDTQPSLARAASQGDTATLNLAHQVGRFISAAKTKGLYTMEDPLPFDLGKGTLRADGVTAQYALENRQIVDYGMGVTGLFTHLKNVRTGEYNVIGLQKDIPETKVLQGAIEHRKSEDKIKVLSGGIDPNIAKIIQIFGPAIADIAIASRVHSAGKDLEQGVRHTSQLLHQGGVLVARGPLRYSKGTDYDKVRRIVASDRTMHIETDKAYIRQAPAGAKEPNRVIIARKK